ncbi:hypothetical protein Agub_g3249, partial [Astrephomene gubernaculifera]
MEASKESLELSPWQGIACIPDHERNAFERDFAHAVEISMECEHMPCDTLEQAAKFGRRILVTNWLTGGLIRNVAGPPFILFKLWEAVRHAERLTCMHFTWFDSATRKEISFQEANRRMRAGQADSMMQGAITRGNPDPAVYEHMTCDEFVLAMCSLNLSQKCHHWVSCYNLAASLYGEPRIQQRIRTVLLPQLAQCDVGEPVHMDVSQWEAVWITWLVPYLMEGIRQQPPTSAVALQARMTIRAAAKRLLEAEPGRAMNYRVAMEVAAQNEDPSGDYSAACTLARLGEEQGNDFAVAVGTWNSAVCILRGAQGPRVPTCRLGELRELVGKAVAAGKRLKRWRMKPLLMATMDVHVAFVKQTMKDLQHLPDDEEIRLPHMTEAAKAAADAVLRAGAAGTGNAGAAGVSSGPAATAAAHSRSASPATAAASNEAATESGCHGCGHKFASYQRCGGCRQRRYCSRACQAADWRAGHKQQCKQLA